jgi:sterol desaturase/sphingolipid hydroxylase (fatty acid hydroxylase superfamily)
MQQYFLWVYAGTAVILIAEIVAGRHKGAYRLSDFPLFLGSILLGRATLAPLVAGAVAGLYGLAMPSWRSALADTPFWLAFPVLLLTSEFVFYWVHRWAHENKRARVPLLWKLHRTHHSGRHMNVVLQMRVNLFWYMIFPTAWTLGLALHLGLGLAAAAVTLTTVAWNTVTHSSFRWDDAVRQHGRVGPVFRALEHVFVSPGLHHTHHGFGKDGAGYRNFGTVLSLWDWVFGTLHIPEGRPWRYGNPGPTAHWLEELFYPLVNFGGRKGEAA